MSRATSRATARPDELDEEASEVFAEQARRRARLLRSYKIQEVIKRRQILLVQVVKEERGNKGAALTTYLSLAGRYCVLMPNTGRGGGISRKIANPGDRSRLKEIARGLEVPDGMGLIIRTAGQERNKLEIRRDYEYLLRLWNDIRELTLQSIAPCTIHEEGALVKRAVRDLYGADVEEILVEGEEGYRSARKVMSMLMPSRARRIKLYKEELPLFMHYGVEDQLDALHSPVVQLRSGGSIVIHTTEALTAIDVNSGRSTRERNIEETALKTNLEAADAAARHLRLRDLAGLIVVDFIDMVEARNQKAVERRLRDALKSDRARVQFGRISPFGLLELSRQRLRPSLQELSTQACPVCAGSGVVRSVESAALRALRGIELEGLKGTVAALSLTLPEAVALYILNQKRHRLVHLEQRYGLRVDVQVDRHMTGDQLQLVCTEQKTAAAAEATPEVEEAETVEAVEAVEEEDAGGRKRRRRRRRKRRGAADEVEHDAPIGRSLPPMAGGRLMARRLTRRPCRARTPARKARGARGSGRAPAAAGSRGGGAGSGGRDGREAAAPAPAALGPGRGGRRAGHRSGPRRRDGGRGAVAQRRRRRDHRAPCGLAGGRTAPARIAPCRGAGAGGVRAGAAHAIAGQPAGSALGGGADSRTPTPRRVRRARFRRPRWSIATPTSRRAAAGGAGSCARRTRATLSARRSPDRSGEEGQHEGAGGATVTKTWPGSTARPYRWS